MERNVKDIISKIPIKPYFQTELGVLYNADCLEIMKYMPNGSVDMLLNDPPYGMNLDTDFSGMESKPFKGKTGGNYHEKVIGDDKDYDPSPIMQHFHNVQEQFWFGADYYCQRIENINQGSWFVWDKRLTDSADKMWGSCFELLWSKTQHKRDILRFKWAGIFGMEKQDTKKRLHPNQKHISLIKHLILKHSKPNDIIADFYLGSGTTAVACEQLGRRWIGVEISEKYCEIAKKRIDYEAKQGKFDFGGKPDNKKHGQDNLI